MPSTKNQYIRYLNDLDTIPVFFRPWWLDIVSGDQDWDAFIVEKDDSLLGIWPFMVKKKWGLKYAPSFVLTPFLGPWILYPTAPLKTVKRFSFEQKVYTHFAELIKAEQLIYFNQNASDQFVNGLPLRWMGVEEKVAYRFVIKHLQDIDLVFSNFKHNKKYYIKKFAKKGTIESSDTIEPLYALIQSSFKRRGAVVPYASNMLALLFQKLRINNQCKVFYAFDKEEITAGVFVVYDQQTAYLLCTGFSHKNNDAVTALIWHAIKTAASRCHTFDFCGSVIPGIAEFFKDFGGHLHAYSSLQYFSNNWIKVGYLMAKQFSNNFK